MSEKKGEVREAIIKALSNKIVEEIKKELNVATGRDDFGNIIVEANKKVVDYLIHELAVKRLLYGLALNKEPEDW